jgi:hypothetical protein
MPPRSDLTLSKGTWATLLTLALSIVGSLWTFTLTVSADIRELKTDVKAIDSSMHSLDGRVGRIEAVHITPR